MYDDAMRTTIDLPTDLHAQLMSLARDRRQSLSHTTAELLYRCLGHDQGARVAVDPASGQTLLYLSRPITEQDVRCLEDDPRPQTWAT
jgi:hypothetical protein